MQDIKAVFDIGNGYIKGAVFVQEDDNVSVLAKDIVKIDGMRKSKILDIAKFAKNIGDVMEKFVRKMGGDFVDEVIVGISHPEMQIERITEHKRVLNPTITNADVNHLSKLMTEISHSENYETVKILPIYRIIDETRKEKDPIWLQAKRLWLMADVFRIPKNFYNQILETFQKLHIKVVDIVPNILATAEAALDFDQKDLGSLVIDIGTNQTSYVVFEDGYPLEFGLFPYGWEDVTKDISIGMKVDIIEAEDLKVSHAIVSDDPDNPVSHTDDSPVDSLFLTQIVSARYAEIFELIQQRLVALDRDGRLAWWVYITWWATKIPWILDLAKKVFTLACFEAKEKRLHVPDLSKNKQFLNCLWLYLWYTTYGASRGGGLGFGLSMGWMNKIWWFFKDLF